MTCTRRTVRKVRLPLFGYSLVLVSQPMPSKPDFQGGDIPRVRTFGRLLGWLNRELISLRRRQPALRGEGINVFHVHNANRVIAFQRWVEEDDNGGS
jgi:hypothetical protein